MIKFIKSSSLEFIRYKLLLLYLLNVIDIVCTLLLLKTGCFIEANTIMTGVIQSSMSSFIVKGIFPAALLYYLYVRIQKANEKQLRQSNYFINGVIALYTFINLSHILWIVLLPLFWHLQ